MLPGFAISPLRRIEAEMRSCSASESSSVLAAVSVAEPRLIAQPEVLTGWMSTKWSAAAAVMPEPLAIATRFAFTAMLPEFENTAALFTGFGALRLKRPFGPAVNSTAPPAVPFAAMPGGPARGPRAAPRPPPAGVVGGGLGGVDVAAGLHVDRAGGVLPEIVG